MNDVIVELGVETTESEAAMLRAVDAFTRWREETSTGRYRDRHSPDLIVKTTWTAEGKLRKKLIFQDPSWADQFLVLFRSEIANVS